MVNRKLPVTLRCSGLFLIVLGALALGPTAAIAQVHTTGLPVTKSCPPTADSGTTYDCTFTVANADDLHGVINLVVTETAPFPGGTPITVDCLQGGIATTTLGTSISGEASCGGTITITAPFNCTAENTFNQDQIAATGNDADTGQFAGLPVSGSATNNTLTPPLVCDDGLFCTDDSCDPATGCVTVPHVCNDNLTCTTDLCNEDTDVCDFTPVVCAPDADLCTIEACVEGQGCQSGPPTTCDQDANLCNTEACVPATGLCESGPDTTCDQDANLCNTEACVPATGLCESGPDTTCDQDANLCNTEACVPATGLCESGPDTTCADDANLCNGPEACVPATGLCESGPPLVCDDGLFCTDDSCVPATGCTTTDHDCADALLCTNDSCDEDGDTCVNAPVVCTPDADLCTTEACNPANGLCESGPPTTCPDDADLCNGVPVCDPTTGACDPGTPVDCPDDADLCNGVPVCNPTTGACDPGTSVVCDDPVCTECNPTTGVCDLPADPLPAECNEEICRTPGFWGTHGGEEKNRSTNITQAILDTFGGTLTICGTTISNTDVGSPNSALEAICVSPRGDSRLQLARQLTAAALNCGITSNDDEGTCSTDANGAAPCAGVSIGDVFDACNAACPTGTTAVVDGNTISCIEAIDCFNNGGIFDPATGNCDDATGTSCHDRDLVNGCFAFTPPGPAGSSDACNEARKSPTTVLP